MRAWSVAREVDREVASAVARLLARLDPAVGGVGEHEHQQRHLAAHDRLELADGEAEAAVAHHRHALAPRVGEPRAQRRGHRVAERAVRAVGDEVAARLRAARSRPTTYGHGVPGSATTTASRGSTRCSSASTRSGRIGRVEARRRAAGTRRTWPGARARRRPRRRSRCVRARRSRCCSAIVQAPRARAAHRRRARARSGSWPRRPADRRRCARSGRRATGCFQRSVVVEPGAAADEDHEVGLLARPRASATTPPFAPTTPAQSGWRLGDAALAAHGRADRRVEQRRDLAEHAGRAGGDDAAAADERPARARAASAAAAASTAAGSGAAAPRRIAAVPCLRPAARRRRPAASSRRTAGRCARRRAGRSSSRGTRCGSPAGSARRGRRRCSTW